MNRRGLLRDLLVSFAATTALAKHALAVVDEHELADPDPTGEGSRIYVAPSEGMLSASITFRLKATALDGTVAFSDWQTLTYPVGDGGVIEVGRFDQEAQIQSIVLSATC